jgi:UDP-N-acetylmuramoyl-tripeptide--D-alanyl-D-alanine ligase
VQHLIFQVFRLWVNLYSVVFLSTPYYLCPLNLCDVTITTLYQTYLQHPVICTDSRHITPGCLFFALKGDKFDGNQFVNTALQSGAAFAIADDPALKNQDQVIWVEDVLTTLQHLARHHRRTFHIPVIAIGGSNGKTTTKELVAAVLSSHYPCHFTKGNLNNHIGVPLTLLAMPSDTEVAVIEVGTNHIGEIAELCRIVEPTHGLITNIGKEHLEGFGNLAGVKKAEGELYRYLAKTNGCTFVNLSEKYLGSMATHQPYSVRYAQTTDFKPIEETFIEVKLVRQTPFIEADFLDENGQPVRLKSQLFGRHNFQNIMSAVALGMYFKVPSAKITAAISNYVPANNRSQVIQRGSTTILLDAYNANPSSMSATLQVLDEMEATRKIAILGDMLELGQESVVEHRKILALATKIRHPRCNPIVLVGKEFAATNHWRYKDGQVILFENAAQAREWFKTQDLTNTLVLIKGSRGIRLEQILD